MYNKGHGELHIVVYAAMHLLVCYRLTCLDGENKKLSQVKDAIKVLKKTKQKINSNCLVVHSGSAGCSCTVRQLVDVLVACSLTPQ